MSDATNPAVVQDAQQYDWREDWNRVQTRIGYDEDAHVDAMHRLAAHIERLEAERDALLAEHEAWAEWGNHSGDALAKEVLLGIYRSVNTAINSLVVEGYISCRGAR